MRSGYTLVRPPSTITVREALEAIEGAGLSGRRVFMHRQCIGEKFCFCMTCGKTSGHM
jgi:DNA-binding IscR family transcriptional regulator